MSLTMYPLDNIDYSADDAALFHCTRTSGVYSGSDFSCAANGANNTVTVGMGVAWMRLNRFRGCVAAMKKDTSLDMGLADAMYPRIDRVVLQFDANKNAVDVVVKKGTPASSPAAPSRSTTESLYELHLAEVRREPGATAIAARDVRDLRMDPSSCGLMADSVTTVDTSAIHAQVTALIDALRQEIADVESGDRYLPKSGGTMTGDISMDSHKLTSLPTPAADTDAATKSYVDNRVQPVNKGGTGATDGSSGLKNLLAAGKTVLSANQYGTALPAAGTPGRIFFKKV